MRKTIIASTFLIIGYVVASSASCGGGNTNDMVDGDTDGEADGSSGSGGVEGSGGAAGTGGAKGAAGTGGEKGSGGKGGSGGYFAMQMPQINRSHAVALATGATETVPFAWHSALGVAAPSDLWVEANGKPVLQVFSMDDKPFVRAGLDVAPIDPNANYNLVISRSEGSVSVALVRGKDEVVLRTQAAVDSRTAMNSVANVVLPPTFLRSSVVTTF